MELWVRSQDKEILMKANRIDADDKNIIVWDNDCHCGETYMGEYKSKERALEILDEIQKTIINNEVIRIIMPNVKDMRGNEELYKENVFNTMVYEMPKE